MLKILSELYSSKKTASIYDDRNETSKFHYGAVIGVNENNAAIENISPDGEWDGITLVNTEAIFRIEKDGLYDKKMKKLMKINAPELFRFTLNSENLTFSLLSLALETKKIVSLELCESGCYDITGFVEESDEERCKIHLVDEYGENDGFSYILLSDITWISYDSEDEKRILRLWEANNNSQS